MKFDWHGVLPAILTPFTANDELDLVLFEKNLQAQLDAGIHGVVPGGSLGEARTITAHEKEKLIRCAVEFVAGKVPVIMNIAESTTK